MSRAARYAGVALAMATTLMATTAFGELGRGDRYSGAAWATRSPVLAQHGMVATEQPLASELAIGILKKGGSAVDAVLHSVPGSGRPQPKRRFGDVRRAATERSK